MRFTHQSSATRDVVEIHLSQLCLELVVHLGEVWTLTFFGPFYEEVERIESRVAVHLSGTSSAVTPGVEVGRETLELPLTFFDVLCPFEDPGVVDEIATDLVCENSKSVVEAGNALELLSLNSDSEVFYRYNYLLAFDVAHDLVFVVLSCV